MSWPTTGTYSSANAGSRTVTATLTSGDFSAGTGTLLSNYALSKIATGTGTIDRKSLSVSGVTAENKVYDGTTADNLDTRGATLSGILGSDQVSLGSGTDAGSFQTANVGTGIVVTAHLTLSGASAGNYALIEPTGLTANITPRPLSLSDNDGMAERLMNQGYPTPGEGLSIQLEPLKLIRLTTTADKPTRVTFKVTEGGVSIPARPRSGTLGFDAFSGAPAVAALCALQGGFR